MEYEEHAPKTPPPPYRTLPPTPALSTASGRAPPRIPPEAASLLAAKSSDPPVMPNAIRHAQTTPHDHICTTAACGPSPHNHYIYPRHHAHLLNLPFRPAHRCGHSGVHLPHVRPVCYVHTGGNPAPAAVPFTQLPQPQQPQQSRTSYLQLGPLAATLNDAGSLAVEAYGALVNSRSTREQYGGVMDAVALRLDDVLTSIDDGTFKVNSADIAISENHAVCANADAIASTATLATLPSSENNDRRWKRNEQRRHTSPSSSAKNSALVGRVAATSPNPFSKAYQYANAYTSAALPPLKLYFATWPLICLASTYSRRAYEKPSGKERQNYISGDWRRGTKTVVLKSIPLDEKNTIVLAIRGTQNFQDWAVNVRTEPTAPTNFLDDDGNLCHAGFLRVARKMVTPVADHLRDLLRENPRRSSCSLILTGHSAGGAVAALLYCHMLSQTVTSELTHLQDFFKRIHCITFGAPPISLLPLQKPDSKPQYHKNLFFGFINEGDPVARADVAYVKSLLELYARPAPAPAPAPTASRHTSSSSLGNTTPIKDTAKPTWTVPEATLSLAGRIIVMRARRHSVSNRPSNHQGSSTKHREKDSKKRRSSSSTVVSIEAVTTSDAELRGLVFGDPLMHTMDLYAQRIEHLATRAVVGSTGS